MSQTISLPGVTPRIIDNVKTLERDGVPLEKGIIVTNDYLTQHKEFLGNIANIFTVYPDIYLDIITPEHSSFSLYFYQRIVLRALMRYKEVYITAPRALTESAHKIGLIAGNP